MQPLAAHRRRRTSSANVLDIGTPGVETARPARPRAGLPVRSRKIGHWRYLIAPVVSAPLRERVGHRGAPPLPARRSNRLPGEPLNPFYAWSSAFPAER